MSNQRFNSFLNSIACLSFGDTCVLLSITKTTVDYFPNVLSLLSHGGVAMSESDGCSLFLIQSSGFGGMITLNTINASRQKACLKLWPAEKVHEQ